MMPLGWIAFYHELATGQVLRYSSRLVPDPRTLPPFRCLGSRVIYVETTPIGGGRVVHYSDVFLGHDFIEFWQDRGAWNCRNADVVAGEAALFKEGVSLPDEGWYALERPVFFNNRDNLVGAW